MSRHMWASQANLRGVFGSQEGAVEVFGAAFGFVAGQCVPVDDGGEVGPVVVVGGAAPESRCRRASSVRASPLRAGAGPSWSLGVVATISDINPSEGGREGAERFPVQVPVDASLPSMVSGR